ncbi:ATPase [Sphingomonas sp. EC-HK361]|uniref:sensor histidine kinase n=1 Tax=Sphingomonas sp. EC-HK361 TaxID=2038397 RepID=UPI001256D54F|nr:ATP-binding protein [Sphingomonas sp. EC-HK361]VVT14087.1 ATPase [Sphingomonas sp. EC-HK361]
MLQVPGRFIVAIALVAVGAAANLFLPDGLQSALVSLIAGIAAILVVGLMGDEEDAGAAVSDVDQALHAGPLDEVLDAIAEPVLIVSERRVAAANRAAIALLGGHVMGEDVRTAIRHPAAAERLASDAGDSTPVLLAGLGAPDQRWEMRVTSTSEGLSVVHLIDQSARHAAEQMRVDFVANASHELRTPLASILGYVETLRDEAGEDAEVRDRFLKIMFDEARRMQRLVDDLISLSRIESEKHRPPERAIDLAELIEGVRDELANDHGARGQDIVLEAPATSPRVTGDETQVSQVLHNIIGNAMKYGRPGTPIRITLSSPAGGMVRLTVADEGEGIAAEHLPRLTERFYRVDAGRSRALGGTGLGLAIVKHIVERHRGRLEIASTPGVGTRVSILLPVTA